ncbi:MAG: hypothetical protein HY002_09885 [Candidatus Rokubacteria bacterium]|nr:hypothetical protein [Candidatus Rokubacteria bacterium]
MPVLRRTELHRRRARREKLAKLRRRYEAAEADAEKVAVLKKLFRVAPWLASEWQHQATAARAKAAPPPEEAVAKKRAPQARGASPRPREGAPEADSA